MFCQRAGSLGAQSVASETPSPSESTLGAASVPESPASRSLGGGGGGDASGAGGGGTIVPPGAESSHPAANIAPHRAIAARARKFRKGLIDEEKLPNKAIQTIPMKDYF